MNEPYTRFPPGHFYSTLPSLEEVRANEARLFGPSAKLGIRLDLDAQLALLSELSRFYATCPYAVEGAESGFREPGLRYRFPNDQFSLGDAILLHCMLRHLRPRRLIEVGSGWTSCVTLDVRQQELHELQCVFVDPHPERLESAIFDDDRRACEIVRGPVQQTPTEWYEALDAGDVLFVDSSHVAKIGSDVNFLFFEVLPRLRPGVVVHFHDVHSEFEYRRDLVYGGCFWNEAYLLRAFLMYNARFRILFFSSLLSRTAADAVRRAMPQVLDSGSSLWLRRAPDAGEHEVTAP